MTRTRRFLSTFGCILLIAAAVWPRQRNAPAPPASSATSRAEFLQAADEVLADMSKLLSLPVVEPLKKSIRSREEIRAYLVEGEKKDKDDAKQYADQRALEAFGLLPKDYPLQQKLLALLTEQIAGLYDPKSREFFIADWTSPADQRVIMAHELTHALQDQHFHIQKWQDAVKTNDDASLARDAVLEGTATIAMVDYLLRDTGKSSSDIPDLDPSLLLGNASDSPELSSAPLVIQEEMLFPYIAGSTFSQHVLRAYGGWTGLHKLFENPPVSSQQIIHPDLYLQGVMPKVVSLVPMIKAIPHGWKKLDENIVGELFWRVVLEQFLGQERASDLAPSWAGDRYAVFEQQHGGPTLLVVRLELADAAGASRFFGGYSQVLEMKHEDRTNLFRRPNFFSFETPAGGVFLRCAAAECLIAEGTTRETFDAMTRSIGWPAGPEVPAGNGVIVRGPASGNRENAFIPRDQSIPLSAAFASDVTEPTKQAAQ
jgi:hypothetical protein